MSRPHLRYKNQTRRERTWTIHLISLEKVIKATILLVVAYKLLSLFNRDVHAWAEDFVTRHGIDLANRYVHATLERLVGFGNTQVVEISAGATVYASLLYVEGIGLWLQKRWAEYLTAILTALLIPVELYEIFEKFTWVRVGILALNIFIVWYLATRLRDEKKEQGSNDENERTQIKICGITNLEDAKLSVDYGADQLGFNFYPKSPRYIDSEAAHAIAAALPDSVFKVGVFVNETIETVCKTVDEVGLDAVQLHGDEDEAFIAEIKKLRQIVVIKAFGVSPEFQREDLAALGADAILLDSYSEKARGGTGETFDWSAARAVSKLFPDVYLAGGLSPQNVGEAIRTVRPYAVDVCSRIESEPGKKDAAKLKQFIDAVRKTI